MENHSDSCPHEQARWITKRRRQGALDGRSGIVVVYGTIRYSVSEAEGRHVSRRHEGWKRKARAARSPHETMTGVGRPSVWGEAFGCRRAQVRGDAGDGGGDCYADVAEQMVLSRGHLYGVQEAEMEGRCDVCLCAAASYRSGWRVVAAIQSFPRPDKAFAWVFLARSPSLVGRCISALMCKSRQEACAPTVFGQSRWRWHGGETPSHTCRIKARAIVIAYHYELLPFRPISGGQTQAHHLSHPLRAPSPDI
jgi:hypothetical protein